METREAHSNEREEILNLKEDHFNDFKSKDISPSKLQKSFVAFANSDGGELWIGVEDKDCTGERLRGFEDKEEANDIIHVLLEETHPSVEDIDLEFIKFENHGYILHISIPKSPKVHYTSSNKCYIRVNASTRSIKGDRIVQLGYSKGSHSYEKQPVDILEVEDFIQNKFLKEYMERIDSELDTFKFLRKQRLLTKKDGEYSPNVACALMYDEEPQASLDTRCSIKIYRLLTSDNDYKREYLKEPPVTINRPIEQQIYNSKKTIVEMLEDASFQTKEGTKNLRYPIEAIHEILVNAIIHRDYSLNDDVHIIIFDNRIEIKSPGKLPGYITLNNIYDERFSRNPNIVRLLHKLPDPVNYDIGEGLKTAKNEMNEAGLVDPLIDEGENSVIVTIKHQKLASIEDVIINYLSKPENDSIKNKKVRELTGVKNRQKVKYAFQKLRDEGKIEPVDPEASPFYYKWELSN